MKTIWRHLAGSCLALAIFSPAFAPQNARAQENVRLAPTFLALADDTVVASAVATEAPFRADHTGKNDATSAIQSALDRVAQQGGGVVFLPAGRYRLDGTLKIGYATTLCGAGSEATPTEEDARVLAAAQTTLLASGAPADKPLIDATAFEGGIVGLNIWYPQQNAEDIVAYPFAIVAAGADIRNVALLNAYNGVELQSANACFVENLVGTVLRRGVSAPLSSEFSWMRNARFDASYWKRAAPIFGGQPLSAAAAESLDQFTRRHLVGLELGRIDGMAIDGFYTPAAAVPVRIEKTAQQNQNRVFGFGGVVRDFPKQREEFGWDAWYYGMRYANVDNVRGVSAPPTRVLARVAAPLRRDAAAFFDVTRAPYFAVGDGKTDDTAAIQSALDDAGKIGGGTAYLPPGVYRVTHPLNVPRGVELRGPLGRGKARAYRNTCSLAADFDADNASAESAPALLTLQEKSGVRGFEIVYPAQPFAAARLRELPFAIRGRGADIAVRDLLLVNAFRGIDLASTRCDRHVVAGVWATALSQGVVVGGGSRDGHLERIAFSYGPWLESWLLRDEERARGEEIAKYHREHVVAYQFGDCAGETGWGLAAFNPLIHMKFARESGGVPRDATFSLSMFDVAHRTLLQMDAGKNIRLLGFWGTGGGGEANTNWLEVAPDFAGPLDISARAIQQSFLHRPLDFRREQVRFHDEYSLATGRAAKADFSAAGHAPSLAFDGDARTFWQARAGSWLQVDLGSERIVTGFRIESAGLFGDAKLNTQAADLYLSRDGAHFQRAARLETFGAAWSDRPIEPTPARYARLVVTKPGADNVIRVASFDVW